MGGSARGRSRGRNVWGIAVVAGLCAAGNGLAAPPPPQSQAPIPSQRRLPYPDDPPRQRDWLSQQVALCDGADGPGAIGVCGNLIDSPWFAGALLGRLYARRGQAYLEMGDEPSALRDFDYGLQFYDQNDPLPGGTSIQADPASRLPGPVLADNTRLRAAALCDRAEIRWRGGDAAGAEADYRAAQGYAPDAACAAAGLSGLAADAPPPDLAERRRQGDARRRQALLGACAGERTRASQALFGPQAGEADAARLDAALTQMGVFSSDLDALVRSRALHGEGGADGPGEAYLLCLQTARIRQLNPGHDFSPPDGGEAETREEPPEADIFAALPRRDAGAATGLLSESLDPNARRQRQTRVAQDAQRREAAIQQRAANRAAFWSALGDVLAAGAQVYVATETARLQLEAAQAANAAYVPTPSAATAAQVAAVVAPRDQGFAVTLPPTGAQGQASAGAPGSQRHLSNAGGNCLSTRRYSTAGVGGNHYIEHHVVVTNSCDFNISFEYDRLPQSQGRHVTSRAVVYSNREHDYYCLEHNQNRPNPLRPTGCTGVSDPRELARR